MRDSSSPTAPRNDEIGQFFNKLLGRSDDAKGRLVEAVQISPTIEVRARADFIRAILSSQQGIRAEALDEMAQVLEEYAPLQTTPDHRDLYEDIQLRRAFLMVELSRFGDAVTVLRECLSFDLSGNDKGDVLYNLGRCYYRLADFKEAEEKLLETVRNGAQNRYVFSAHSMLGMIYYHEGAYAKALPRFEWCLPHAKEVGVPIKDVYAWLASTARGPGLKDDAKRYEKLAK
jgi:tetratricopeptide (TPR) repeat protein